MEFLVTQVQAKHKTYRPISTDTLIFEARDYFEKKNKYPYQTAMAYFYSGCVYGEQPDKQAQSLSAAGRMHLLLKQSDSAFYYFHKGLEKAKTSRDNILQSLLAQNLSVAYAGAKQYEQAMKFLLQSYQLNKDSTELPRYYLNFANIYNSM